VQAVLDSASVFRAANVAVPFCLDYQMKGCSGCPLEQIDGQGREERLLKVLHDIQTHLLAILAGNILRKEPLISAINGLVTELETLKAESKELGD
jgi:hypothetical protein